MALLTLLISLETLRWSQKNKLDLNCMQEGVEALILIDKMLPRNLRL